MAVRVAKVQAFNRCIRNVVIRYIVPNLVSAIVAKIQGVRDRMKLHSDDIPDACRSLSFTSGITASMKHLIPVDVLAHWHTQASNFWHA